MKTKTYNIKKLACIALAAVILFTALPITAKADTGPKPSVVVNFKNMGDELCYATLLSVGRSTGPHSAWDGIEGHENVFEAELEKGEERQFTEREIWQAFVDYKDEDGYYFLQIFWKVSDKKSFTWGYYPPKTFKVLLYYPNTNEFAVSTVCEKYAFDSYYTIDMQGTDIGSIKYDEENSTDERLIAYRSYNYFKEGITLFIRACITIVIELFIAYLFSIRSKKEIVILLIVNVITQIALNGILFFVSYLNGPIAFLLAYAMIEVLIFIAEGLVYWKFINKYADKKREWWYYLLYSFVANVLSVVIGLLVASSIPTLF